MLNPPVTFDPYNLRRKANKRVPYQSADQFDQGLFVGTASSPNHTFFLGKLDGRSLLRAHTFACN